MSSPDEQDFPGHLLHQAALWDNEELLLDLLNGELVSHINSQDSWGRTPLHAAATTDNSKCLRILLKAGADPNIASGAQDNFKTPLHTAAEHGFLSNVKLLVQAGASLEKCEGLGYTGLDLAERGGHVLTFQYLKDAEQTKEEAREDLHTALRNAVTAGDVEVVRNLMKDVEKEEAESIVNLTPNGANSLLFKACETGNRQLVDILINAGADGRVHAVTKYSPLYIACYYGQKEIMSKLLKKFPSLVQVPTVEKWLPLHACCINGHANILETLLKFDYPSDILMTYRHFSGDWEYDMAFDINMKDVSGQNALYIACQIGNLRLVDTILKHRVEVRKPGEVKEKRKSIQPSESQHSIGGGGDSISPKRKVSDSIQGIISKLSLATNQKLTLARSSSTSENLLCPLDVNSYCEEYQTPLHVAVKQRNHPIATLLLNAKADPNLPILANSATSISGTLGRSSRNKHPIPGTAVSKRKDEAGSSTALVEACLHRDLGMIELLLKHGARDDDCKAISTILHDDIIVGKILALKAHLDSENKVNSEFIHANLLVRKPMIGAVASASYLPTSAVNVNWHNQKLDRICEQWLINAGLRVNSRLRLCPRNQYLSVQAITRLDLSSNSLKNLPPVVWSLCSLKSLNLSRNKIERLDLEGIISGTSPVLEEILLQENELESIPEELFTHFPALNSLNLSNNKLQTVPASLWSSPKLQELNLSLNLLAELPGLSSSPTGGNMTFSMFESITTSSVISPDSEMGPKSPDFIMVELGKGKKEQDKDPSGQHPPTVVTHHALWRQQLNILKNQELKQNEGSLNSLTSPLLNLNLAYNSFHKVPRVLACLAPNLQRLNMSNNNLKGMGNVSEYPGDLRQLDLSHNQIEKWFTIGSKGGGKLFCYGRIEGATETDFQEDRCIHKRHSRLDHLKTLLLSGNMLKTIVVAPEEPDDTQEEKADVETPSKKKNTFLWFPGITMIDLSENKLREVTPRVSELCSLSVLNLSGNTDVSDLPPEMGLLSRMWNLNITGCNLQEPLKSMIESKRCKTMDIIGYLKSVLEDAKTYSRMKLMVVGIQGIGKTSLLQLLRQEGSSGKSNVAQDHWARRMGAANKMALQKSGKPISTVGVDIGSWILEPKAAGGARFGPVQFRTWDFGGQREYYATHVYFLSRRSLYLVLWNICDGEKGLNEITQWLVNIQARAPNSPVIIVGTHFDLVSEKFPPGYLDYLQQKIRDKFICISDPEKRGLPKVLFSVEISCKTKHNIRHLCALIYESVFNIKTSTGKRLLEQKIPSKYIHLEEIVAYLATERKSQRLDPVLSEAEFKAQVSEWLDRGFGLSFRDDAEIMQACSFLHENGVLLHYEDSTLRDLYFLDPQWLCDMLAHVVTVREINPFAKNGVMKVDDLLHLFKSQNAETREYVMSLLSKFELAVPFDNTRLLIPSLLPSLEGLRVSATTGICPARVRVPMRSRGWALKQKVNRMSRHISDDNISGSPSSSSRNSSCPNSPSGKNNVILGSASSFELASTLERMPSTETAFHHIEAGEIPPINRFLLLSYFPSGFWPRLVSRLLSDDRIVEIIRNYFEPHNSSADITPEVVHVLDQKAEWCCWQTGMELRYGDLLVMRMKEIREGERPYTFMLRRDDGALCESDGVYDFHQDKESDKDASEQTWDAVDLSETGLLEMHIPCKKVIVRSPSSSSPSRGCTTDYRTITLLPSIESIAKLLALTVDHVDTLLEDWYPSIGTRFVHTSEGKYLITRLIPCPHCFPNEGDEEPQHNDETKDKDTKHLASFREEKSSTSASSKPDFFKMLGFGIGPNKSPRMSSDSGVGNSPTQTLVSSVESVITDKDLDDKVEIAQEPGAILLKTGSRVEGGFGPSSSPSFASGLNYFLRPSGSFGGKKQVALYSWSVEYCILHGQKGFEDDAFSTGYEEEENDAQQEQGRETTTFRVKCPKHGDILLRDIAPDILFLDLSDRYRLSSREIQKGSLLGRGAFGFVFSGNLARRGSLSAAALDVAIKMFQPIDPGALDNNEAQVAYKLARNKWLRAPAQSACRAYIAARGEVRVLYWVAHPNVVPFIGLCQSPLAIIMPRAPRGALDTIISDYRRSGDKVKDETIRVTLIQISKALEYLHGHRIIYRDLKSENVLVWGFPQPFAKQEDLGSVDVKLADYGISRASFATGSKGFGGTEGFMAPEIIRYNGEEEYTEKVDIFSFGMMLYELISLRQPFDGSENVKESILEGMRPALSQRDCDYYPLYLLDLMTVCWSHNSKDRPSASQIVSIASAPEFTVVRDVVSLGSVSNIVSALGLQYGDDREIWASCSTGGIYCMKIKSFSYVESCHLFEFISGVVTAMCHVEENVWMGDTLGKVHILKISDYSKILECDFESLVGYVGAVVSIKYLGGDTVATAFSSGRLFLCGKDEANPLTELGKTPVIHCLNCRRVEDGTVELWTGEKAGQMTIYSIKDHTVLSQETINHYEPILDAVEVLLMEGHPYEDYLFSYVYPGGVIYGWDRNKREMISRLDVGKLLPVKESMEEELNHKPLQVTVLRVAEREVYVGTNRGFVFLADVKRLRPLTFFRPFEADVRSFWIFSDSDIKESESVTNLNLSSSEQKDKQERRSTEHSKSSPTLSASSNISTEEAVVGIMGGDAPSSSSRISSSPIPNHEFSSSMKSQLVISIGKGFSNLIEKCVGGGGGTDSSKRRRKAFAMVWHMPEESAMY